MSKGDSDSDSERFSSVDLYPPQSSQPGRFMSAIYAIGSAVSGAISSIKNLIATVNADRKIPGLINSLEDELRRIELTERDSSSSRSSEELERSSMEARQRSFSEANEKAAGLRNSLTATTVEKPSRIKSFGSSVARKMGLGGESNSRS